MQVVYPPATERFAKNVASKDVTLKPFDKYAHDLYMDASKVCVLLQEQLHPVYAISAILLQCVLGACQGFWLKHLQ